MNAALLRLILAQVCIHGSMTGMRMATPRLALKLRCFSRCPQAVMQTAMDSSAR